MSAPGAAAAVLRLLASAPERFGGVHLRGPAGPARDAWLSTLAAALPADRPGLKIPAGAGAEALLGGLDLAATLACGRPQVRRGLLARAHGGVLVLPMAERATPQLLACLCQALDEGCVRLEREGLHALDPARFTLVVLDEGCDPRDALPAALLDRLSFSLDAADLQRWHAGDLDAAADLAAQAPDEADRAPDHEAALALLCAGAWQLGIDSLRAPIQALAVARAWSALEGLEAPDQASLLLAATLVYSARARQLPASPEQAPADPPADAPQDPPPPEMNAAEPPPEPPAGEPEAPQSLPDGAAERLVEQVLATLPEDTLARLAAEAALRGSGRAQVQAGRRKGLVTHGRPVGSRPGDPRRGLPLDLLATVRAALPWQRLRSAPAAGRARIAIRAGDLQVRRLKPRTRGTALFAVDASGSAALHRLNEAKGAVAALLAQCYVRRDQVALISFRGPGAELRLPPTRSLARVHRELSSLPGGGGTPLASGLALATQLGSELRRRGEAPLLVLLTDGRANVSRDGIGGRARAEQEAFAEAAALRAAGVPALLVDISPQPQPRARLLAQAMGAEYLALPAAGAQRLADAVAQRLPGQEGRRA